MRKLHFILSAHPYAMERGDAAVTRVLLETAAEMAQVEASALWSGASAPSPFPIACLTRPPVRFPRLAVRSMATRRSLLHTRFNEPELREHLRAQQADGFVAVHSYMAEPFLSAFPSEDQRAPLYVNYVVSESDVLRASPRLRLARTVEARRTFRDDVRCCTAAAGTGGFHRPEVEALSDAGVSNPELLRIVLPPHAGPTTPGPHLLFLGDRTWHPNVEGLRRLCAWWPEIMRRVPNARLLVAGTGPVPTETRQPGVEVVGFVDSLDTVWAETRALVAPLTVGGGVRVKILEAAARGVGVIASTPAIGTLDEYLPLRGADERGAVIDACISVLTDDDAARRRAETLFEANRAWWNEGHFQSDVRRWLQL